MLSMGNARYGPLGQEIYKHMKNMGWRQKDLARRAQIGQSTISKIMREENRATPDTLNAIGQAINVDPMHLMRLAGIPLPKEKMKRDPSVEAIAQRLDNLPTKTRQRAVVAMSGVLNAISPPNEPTQPLNGAIPPLEPNDAQLNGTEATSEPLEPIYESDSVEMRTKKFTKIVREFEYLFPEEYERLRKELGDPPVVELT